MPTPTMAPAELRTWARTKQEVEVLIDRLALPSLPKADAAMVAITAVPGSLPV